MRKYTFEVTIYEGSDEWWEESIKNNTDVKELCEIIHELLAETSLDFNLKLRRFENYE